MKCPVKIEFSDAAKTAFDQVIRIALTNGYEPTKASREMADVWIELQKAFHRMHKVRNGGPA